MKSALLSLCLLSGCAAIPAPPIASPEAIQYRARGECVDGVLTGVVIAMSGAGVVHLDVPSDYCEDEAPIRPSRGT